jgi:hypothetical protein
MSTIRVSTALAVLAALALSAFPAQAQEDRSGSSDRPRAERRRPRGDGEGSRTSGPRNEGRRAQADRGRREAPRAEVPRNDTPQDSAPRAQVVPRVDRSPRNDNRDANGNDNRNTDRGNDRGWNASRDGNRDRDGDRDRDRNVARDRRAVPRGNARDGWRNDRGRDVYRYAPPRVTRNYSRPARVWAVPYGYRPRGYNRGWNVNLYFGNAYGYGRPGFYGGSGYGYYALPPDFAYGSLRIVDAPRYAPVFVDGYYAGEVDDYDGIFQRLNLEPGRHLVEVDVYPGAPPLEYEVYIEPGRTVTIHVR